MTAVARPTVGLVLGGALLVALALLPVPDPTVVDLTTTFAAPGPGHLLGTDHLGRDLFARTVTGLWRTVLVVALACGIAVGVGVTVGLVAGYAGRPLGGALVAVADLVLVVPTFVAALVVSGILGLGPVTAGAALGLFGIGPYVHQTRALVLEVRTRPSTDVERLMGTPVAVVLARDVLPAVLPPVRALLGATGAGAAVAYAGLAFIGLGVDTSVPDWGAMLWEYRVYLLSDPLLVLWPTLGIIAVASVLHRVADRGGAR